MHVFKQAEVDAVRVGWPLPPAGLSLHRKLRYTAVMLQLLRRLAEKHFGIVIRRKRLPYKLDLYAKLYSKERLAEKPFYNVGAGDFWHPHWTNIDRVSDFYAPTQKDILEYDLMALLPLPIKDGSAEVIYASHTIEHVKEPAVRNLFSEAYRALAPGGILRITCPDAETDFRAMMSGDTNWFYWDEWWNDPKDYPQMWSAPPASAPIEERWLNHMAGALAPLDISESPVRYNAAQIREIVAEKGFEGALDFFTSQTPYNPARPMNHVSWWTHAKVMQYMRTAGFTDVYRSGWNQSASPVMRHSTQFDSTHPQVSLYVEARK